MTATTDKTSAPPSKNRKAIVITIAILAVLIAAFFLFATFYTEWLWFSQLEFQQVLLVQWFGHGAMFIVGFLGMAVPVWLSIHLAYKLRPVYVKLSSQLGRYQEVIEPLRRLATWGIPILFGFFAGMAASANWETIWLWFTSEPTGVLDPQFGLDVSFYLFTLPFLRSLVNFISAVVLISLLMTIAVSYLYGSVRVASKELRISKSARIQIASTAALYFLVQAVSIWIDRYETLSEVGDRITGPGYTGANAVIPGQMILAIIAVIVAVLFIVTAVVGRWRFSIIGTALMLVSALVLGVAYPWAVTTFQVRPNQLSLERDFYQRNLEGTKAGFGIDELDTSEFRAVTDVEQGQLRSDAETAAQIRIMDPAIISPTVRQLEQYRAYYEFRDPMDVDRYEIDGVVQDTVVSLRELNQSGLGANVANWQATALIYTHGYGMVAAKGNARSVDGYPEFIERGIPAAGFLSDRENFEPRVYFGEYSPLYSIVGAPEGTPPIEMDYPSGAVEGGGEQKTTFSGDGGPNIGNWLNRVLYSMKFQAADILFSSAINDESQILYDRHPALRVQKVAPYLTLDSDPYPTVVDGRIVWVIDGYTTSNNYPYSTLVSYASAVADSSNPNPRPVVDDINYIRNSVKATVDAYDGSVTLYAWDDEDPVLKAYQKIYPNTLKSYTEISGELMSHVRYPTDLFKIQRAMLGTYHVDTPESFFQRDNVWTTPNDPQRPSVLQPPYYLSLRMPDQEEPSYSMFTSFIPGGENTRNVLMGYLAVDSNAGNVAGEKRSDYGKLRMLEIAADTTVPGPGQVQNTFNAEPEVSQYINLLRQGQSEVQLGNLLTIPLGGGLLYVQPVFVQSSGETKLPTLQKVLVSFGNEIAFEDTLDAALDELFKGDSGVDAGDGEVVPNPSPNPGDDGGEVTPAEPDEVIPSTPSPSPTVAPPFAPGAYDEALKAAEQAMLDRDAALKAGDLTKFAEADARLVAAVEQLIKLAP